MDPLVVPSPDHRLTGEAVRAALDADGDPGSLAAVVATAGTTNAGIIDDLAGLGRRRARVRPVVSRGRRLRRRGPVRAERPGPVRRRSSTPTRSSWTRTSGCSRPIDCAALLYRDPALARSVHRQDASYLDVIHEQPAEWNPTDYAYHLTRRARGLPLWFSLAVHGVRRLHGSDRGGASPWPGPAAAEIRNRDYLELICEPDLSVVLFRRLGWGRGRLHRAGPTSCWPTRWRSCRPPRGRARRWRGSRSCIRTRRWSLVADGAGPDGRRGVGVYSARAGAGLLGLLVPRGRADDTRRRRCPVSRRPAACRPS